jgi:hypothetical protein
MLDVRHFDPDTTKEVAAYSFKKSHLSSKEQEIFKNFSYVAPDTILSPKRNNR